MIAIPIFLFVVLLLFFLGGLTLIVLSIISYCAYRKERNEQYKKFNEKYGTREKE